MKLHAFTERHLPEAGRIALAHWGDSVPEIPAELRPLLYEYLVRYYFVPDSPFSFGISEGGVLRAMLLAAPAAGHPEVSDQWIRERLKPEEHALFDEYKAYLDGNRIKEFSAAREDEVILSFFASAQRGCGRMLMQAFEAACHAHGYRSMLLWTDDTCDFSYYYHNGFEEVAKLPTEPTIQGQRLTTYLFRKQLCSVSPATP